MKRHKAKLVEIVVDGESVSAKDCSMCYTIKPLTDYNKRKNGLGGRDSRCRKCYNEATKEKKADYDKKYRDVNRERLNEASRKWHYENRDYANQQRRNHYERNKGHHFKMSKKWATENRERYLEIQRKSSARYRDRNPDYVERCRQASKERYHNNKEEYALRWADYFSENKEIIRERQRQYYRENAEELRRRWREYYRTDKGQLASRRASHRRRERESLTEIDFSEDEWLFCLEFFESTCAYCGITDEDMTMDHFIPVSKLGSFTADNIIPCCSSCNSSKRDSDFFEWFRKQEYYSLEREHSVLGYLFDRENERLKIS